MFDPPVMLDEMQPAKDVERVQALTLWRCIMFQDPGSYMMELVHLFHHRVCFILH